MKRSPFLLALAFAIVTAFLLLHAGDPPRTGPATEKRFPPLKLPPGFKATLFACDPLIEYPSVIAIGPKPGAIFVAIDYMTGLGSDGKVKSEIRLVEDTDRDGYADKATVVARGFNSIQGLAYHEGVLYVMHAPFLTTLRYPWSEQGSFLNENDAKGLAIPNARKDILTGLGLKPEDNSSRLHCANGVVVGHDGWLYLALGDNGVNVPRPEGDRLIHNGGAILRCRPDGRDLHVFSTGLRNIYDIALDAELNVFTRDNENDGGTYMIRVCHSFFGADHGYPYDYEERPQHAMKPIGDFGLGSSAGGVCYLETQFPKEYRGNLFFCEWGKSLVRYPLTPANTGFAPVKEIEFAAGDPKDTYPFKPTDVVVQRDGTLMVADYADGQRPKRGRGRIYHIAYVGKDAAPPKDAAPINSQSYYDRWEAQKALEAGGRATMARLEKTPLNPLARMHMIWALARIDGVKAMQDLLAVASTDVDVSVRIQAVRAIGDLSDPILVEHKLSAGRGDEKLAQALASLPNAKDARLKREIAIVLGRLKWSGTPDWLRDNLVGADDAWAHAALQTMRRADNWPAVLKLLDRPIDAEIRPIALRALADRYETTVVDGLLARLAEERDANRRRECAELLTRVYKKPGPWKYWGYRPGPRPANTEAWERTEAVEKSLDRILAGRDHNERFDVLKHMQREKIPVRLETLGVWLKDEYVPSVAASILASLEGYPARDAGKYLDAVVLNRLHNVANRTTALAMLIKGQPENAGPLLERFAESLEDGPLLADVVRRLGGQPKSAMAAALVADKLRSPNALVRAAAIAALGELRAPAGRDAVAPMLKDGDVRVRRAAAAAAGKLGVASAAEPLLQMLGEADPEIRAACLDSLRRLREPRVMPHAVAALGDPRVEVSALECLTDLGGPDQARAIVEFAKRSPSINGLDLAVRALTAWQARLDAKAPTRHDLGRSIAEIHGASGRLLRWEASPPTSLDTLPQNVARLGQFGPADHVPGWRTIFATGAEARVVPGEPKDPKDSLRLAFADLATADATPVEFLGSSRGGFEVWLNGKSIHRRMAAGKYQIDSDRFAGTLDKGMSRLLVAASAPAGAAEFHLHFRRKSSKAEHEKLAQAALSRSGNAERGRKIFFDKEKSQCLKCHQLGNQGERIGPDLTGVGGRFSRIHIIESILEPSRTIAPSFGTFVVTLKSGKTLNGVKVVESETMATFADNQGQKHTFKKMDIDDVQPSPLSTMPDGLEQRMSADEFVDLIGFLSSQKEK